MRQAVIYTRVSSREQVDNFSLSSQLSACTAYCERNGFGIARVFVEEGESAKSADRTELQNLLSYCRRNRGRVEAVVVYNLSRFARDRFDHHALLSHLRRLGIVLRSVSEPVDETPSGELMDGVLAAIHQFENRLRAERTVSGMKEALREGRWVWKAPLGYLQPQGRSGPMVFDPERADLVLWAYERMARGRTTIEEVRRQVNERGLRTRAGHPVPQQTFSRMLRNPLYVGRIEHAEWGIEAKGAFPALVPETIWARVQSVLDDGSLPVVAGRALDHPDFPLRRFVRCGGCGCPLTGTWSRGNGGRYAYYHCRRRGCRKVKMRAEALEARFVELLERTQPNRVYLRMVRERALSAWQDRHRAAEERAQEVRGRIERLKARKMRLVEGYLDQTIDAATYRQQLDRIGRQLRAAEAERQDAGGEEELDVEGLLGFAEEVLAEMARTWSGAEPEIKRRLEQALYPEGLVYHPDEAFRTAPTPLVFRPLEVAERGDTRLVAPTGFEPVFPP